MDGPFEVALGDGGSAVAVRLTDLDDVAPAVSQLGIARAPVLLLFGGAGRLDDRDRPAAMRALGGLILAAERLAAVILDGGTDAGVMRMLADARAQRPPSATRLVGVAPADKVRLPGSPGTTALARGHDAFMLVPGTDWGDERRWFEPVARAISDGGSAAILVNGGRMALEEVDGTLRDGRAVVVVDGTGRAADQLAAAVRSPDTAPPRLAELARRSGLTSVAARDPVEVADRIMAVAQGGAAG